MWFTLVRAIKHLPTIRVYERDIFVLILENDRLWLMHICRISPPTDSQKLQENMDSKFSLFGWENEQQDLWLSHAWDAIKEHKYE